MSQEFNTGVAHPARVYDYWLGGKDNYAADRALGDAIIAAMPSTRSSARVSRGHVTLHLPDGWAPPVRVAEPLEAACGPPGGLTNPDQVPLQNIQ
jgi:hypothetical protein